MKQGVVLFVSGSFTAFVMMGIFWTIFRNELDAARSLVKQSNATFEEVEGMLDEINRLSAEIEESVKNTNKDIAEYQRHMVKEVRSDLDRWPMRIAAKVVADTQIGKFRSEVDQNIQNLSVMIRDLQKAVGDMANAAEAPREP